MLSIFMASSQKSEYSKKEFFRKMSATFILGYPLVESALTRLYKEIYRKISSWIKYQKNTDQQNNTIEHGVRLEQQSVLGGRATLCTVSAQCEAGFDPEAAIMLFADLADAPYLAIENHSPFWCRPVWGNALATASGRTG